MITPERERGTKAPAERHGPVGQCITTALYNSHRMP